MGNSSSRGKSGAAKSSTKRGKPQKKLVAQDDFENEIAIGGLVVEKEGVSKGGYEGAVKRVEVSRKDELEALKKKEEEDAAREKAEKEARIEKDRLEREDELARLRKSLTLHSEEDEDEDDEVVTLHRLESIIVELERKTYEGDGGESSSAAAPEAAKTGLVQKRARVYQPRDPPSADDPLKNVDESEERWLKSLQENKMVRDAASTIEEREMQEVQYTKMAEEMKKDFDLDTVLAAAGVDLQKLIEEQPETFLRLYYRSRESYGKALFTSTNTTDAALAAAIDKTKVK